VKLCDFFAQKSVSKLAKATRNHQKKIHKGTILHSYNTNFMVSTRFKDG
jgi:hypothetical protein